MRYQTLGHDLARTEFISCEAYFVRQVASSAAESPPPVTARRLCLHNCVSSPNKWIEVQVWTTGIWVRHHHKLRAELPLCQCVSSPGRLRHFALAPDAMIIASHVSGSCSSSPSHQDWNGRWERSIREIISVIIVVPNLGGWARDLSIISGPRAHPGSRIVLN